MSIQSLEVPIIPVFYRDDAISFSAVKEESYIIQLCAYNMRDFENIWMSLEYPANQIAIEQMVHISNIREPIFSNGKMMFKCKKAIPKGEEWTGLVTTLKVKALISGDVKVTLK